MLDSGYMHMAATQKPRALARLLSLALLLRR
jgi:hypothetical protein